jgi:hypothetical protein
VKSTIKIPKDKLVKIERASRRNIEIEMGMRISMNRVHKSIKTYSRKNKHTINYE